MSADLVERKEHIFKWKIENLSLCTKKKGEYVDSPVFRAKSLHDTSWHIRLHPRGKENSYEGYMACYLRRCTTDNGDFRYDCEYEISFTSSEGEMLQSKNASRSFPKGESCGWLNFCEKSIQSSDVSAVLIVRCHLKLNALKCSLRSESTGETSFDTDQCSFKWIIKNINSDCAEAIKFPFSGTSQVELSVQVPDDDIKITVRRGEGVFEAMSVMCQITLLDVEGVKHESERALHLFETKDPSVEDDSWEFPTFLKKSKLNSEKDKYLENDCLALKCELATSNGSQTETVEDKECDSPDGELSPPDTSISYNSSPPTTVLEDYKRLYNDKTHADVKLLVDGQMIQAHKCILSIRSPVFSAMFVADMVESETGSVTIPDLEAETVKSLLEYIYIGSVEKLDYELAMNLIIAADKYQVLPLKEKCANFLKSLLSHSNVCDVLVVSDLIQDEVLKAACVKYIKDNSEHILLSEEWNSVVGKNLKLATDTFIQVSKLTAANCKNLEKK